MNSVARQYCRTQLVLQPIAGGKSTTPFCYGVMIDGLFIPVSHSFAAWVVGEFNRQQELLSCKNLTGTTSTGEGEPSTSLDMTKQSSASYSENLATSTTVCCPSSNSRRNTSEWMNEH